ncbi:unnamed protein product, partial [Mesorhabditis belari]|uniref:Uncharacterized protein n=1 Tax=Mesorhabditis belari TaxID=2138241 RepID=A0AAF3JAS7_9BILA
MGCINSTLNSAFLTGRTNVSYAGSGQWAQRMPPEMPVVDSSQRSQRTSISSSVYNTESETNENAQLKKYFYLSSFLCGLEKEQLLKRLEECIINSDLLLLLATQLSEISDTVSQARDCYEKTPQLNDFLARVLMLDEPRSSIVRKYNDCVGKGMEMNNLWEKEVQAALKTHRTLHDQIVEKVNTNNNNNSDKATWIELTATRAICRQSLLTAGDGMAVFLKIQTRLRTLEHMGKCANNKIIDQEEVIVKLLSESKESIKNIEVANNNNISKLVDLRSALVEAGERLSNRDMETFQQEITKAEQLVDIIINTLWSFYIRTRDRFFEANDQIEAALALQRKTFDVDVKKKMSVPESALTKSDIHIPNECASHDIDNLELNDQILELVYHPLINELKSEKDGSLSVIDEMTEGQPTERINDVAERVSSADVRRFLETPRPPTRKSPRPPTAETIESITSDHEILSNEVMETKIQPDLHRKEEIDEE